MKMGGRERWHVGEGLSNDWVVENMTHHINKRTMYIIHDSILFPSTIPVPRNSDMRFKPLSSFRTRRSCSFSDALEGGAFGRFGSARLSRTQTC
jgi:hypothetical protein